MNTIDIDTVLADVQEMIEKVTESIGSDAVGDVVDEIPTKARDGFIPFTDGGWAGVVTFNFHDEVSWATKLIEPFMKKDQENCAEEFRQEKSLAEDVDVTEHPDWEEWRDDWEQEDETCWFVYVRAIFYRAHSSRNVSGQDEILFCLGINNDFNYGRDHISWMPGVGTTWVWEQNVPVAEIDAVKLEEIDKAMREAWSVA